MTDSIFGEKYELEITVTLKNNGNLLANADVPISTIDFGVIIIRNFQIWKSEFHNSRLKDYVNITPPSIAKEGRKNHYHMYIDKSHKEDWFKLEQYIYDAYIKAKSRNESNNNSRTENSNEEEVNPEHPNF